jgi:hypothetical protein
MYRNILVTDGGETDTSSGIFHKFELHRNPHSVSLMDIIPCHVTSVPVIKLLLELWAYSTMLFQMRKLRRVWVRLSVLGSIPELSWRTSGNLQEGSPGNPTDIESRWLQNTRTCFEPCHYTGLYSLVEYVGNSNRWIRLEIALSWLCLLQIEIDK